METYEVLERALGLIEREENWCQNVRSLLTGAVCAIGAIQCVETDDAWGRCESDAKHALRGFSGDQDIAAFNDTHSHAEVVALFQAAIRSEKAKAGVPIELPTAPSPETENPVRAGAA